MTKVVRIISDVVLIFVILVLALYFILRSMNQILIYSVKTGSMEDNIHAGDYILIIKKDNYQVGDVVTFKMDNGFITHRIIDKNGDVFTTKGDANNIEDSSITSDSIVGKVIISGGFLNFVINYKYALASLLLSLYLFSCYFTRNKEDEDLDDELLDNVSSDDEISDELLNDEESDVLSDNETESFDDIDLDDSKDKNINNKKSSKKNSKKN